MSQRIKAIFHNGVFIPQAPFEWPEDSEVELTIQDPYTIEPDVTDPAQKARLLQEVVQSMRNHPLPAEAPRFTREDLHARR